jgi:hypothetical protein
MTSPNEKTIEVKWRDMDDQGKTVLTTRIKDPCSTTGWIIAEALAEHLYNRDCDSFSEGEARDIEIVEPVEAAGTFQIWLEFSPCFSAYDLD